MIIKEPAAIMKQKISQLHNSKMFPDPEWEKDQKQTCCNWLRCPLIERWQPTSEAPERSPLWLMIERGGPVGWIKKLFHKRSHLTISVGVFWWQLKTQSGAFRELGIRINYWKTSVFAHLICFWIRSPHCKNPPSPPHANDLSRSHLPRCPLQSFNSEKFWNPVELKAICGSRLCCV